VDEATAAYRAEMDPLQDFIAERCVVAPGAWATVEGLWTAYERWAHDAGEKYPLTRRQFGDRLTRRGVPPDKGTGGIRVRRGIGLIATDADDDRVAEVAPGGARSEKFSHEGGPRESLRELRHSAPLAPHPDDDEPLPFGGVIE
jgi:phage/plasmid-associated DNA primase